MCSCSCSQAFRRKGILQPGSGKGDEEGKEGGMTYIEKIF